MSGCVALSAVILTIAVNRHGGFDFGWQADLFYAGIARVVFSFFFGVILMRKFSMHRSKSSIAAWLCVVAVGAVLALSIPASFKVAYELLTVFVIFPAIVLLAMRFDVDASTARVFTFLGVTSYAVYVLHAPAGLLFFAFDLSPSVIPRVRAMVAT
jgi:peptidoglycan/LPS O-acetylase OafA/YrhL